MNQVKQCYSDIVTGLKREGEPLDPSVYYTLDYMYAHCGDYDNLKECMANCLNEEADDVPTGADFAQWVKDPVHFEMMRLRVERFTAEERNGGPVPAPAPGDPQYNSLDVIFNRLRPYIDPAIPEDKRMTMPPEEFALEMQLLYSTFTNSTEYDFTLAADHLNELSRRFPVPQDFSDIMETVIASNKFATFKRLGLNMRCFR